MLQNHFPMNRRNTVRLANSAMTLSSIPVAVLAAGSTFFPHLAASGVIYFFVCGAELCETVGVWIQPSCFDFS